MDELFLPEDILNDIKSSVTVDDNPDFTTMSYFHTGSYALDRIISVRNENVGIPAPCIVELAGPHSTAKTTLGLEMIYNVLEDNGFALMIDAEKRLNDNYASSILGEYFDKLVVIRTRMVEKAFWEMENAARKLVKNGLQNLPAIYVLDSMGSIESESRYKKDSENPEEKYHNIDFGAGKAIRRCLGFAWDYISNTNAVILIINHEHDVIDISNPWSAKFKKKKTAGGVFKDYMAGVKLSVRVIKTNISKGKKVSAIVKVENKKSSVDFPYGKCEFEVKFGSGIEKEKDVYDTAKNLGIIYKENSKWYFDGEYIGSRDVAIERLKTDHDLYDNLVDEIISFPSEYEEDE